MPAQHRPIEAKASREFARPYIYAKRVMDILGSFTLLILFAPLFLLIALAIKLESRGGAVFFFQPRMGRGGKTFGLVKFCTIQRKPTKEDLSGSTQAINGDDNDITRVGRLLRNSGLNELPQLINILKGDMSFIGPRPAVLHHGEYYEDWHRRRLEVHPGVTGLAQVCGRNAIPWGWRVALDRYYVDNVNFLLDFAILFKTLIVVVSGKGCEGKESYYFDFSPPEKDIEAELEQKGVMRYWPDVD